MCCPTLICAKYVLCILNATVIISGVLVAAAGFVSKFVSGDLGVDIIPRFTVVSLIVFGTFMILIGVFGCVVSFTPVALVIRIYAGCLLAMGVMLVCLSLHGLLTGVQTAKDTIRIKREDMIAFQKQYNDSAKARSNIDKMQETFQCCGVDSPQDWRNHYKYPESCCPIEKVNNTVCAEADIYKEGCQKTATEMFHRYFRVLYGLVMLFALVFIAAGGLAIYTTLVGREF